jgi:DNA-binding NtrC family response regulator
MNAVILIAGPAPAARRHIQEPLRRRGYEVHDIESEEAPGALARLLPDLVVIDLGESDGAELKLVKRVRDHDPVVPVLAVADGHDVRRAVAAMKCGADELLEAPLEEAALAEHVERALERATLRRDVLRLAPHAGSGGEEVLLGRSAQIRDIYHTIKRLSRSATTTVMIEGESGTGKELVARAIHATSTRRERPFVAVNCAALSESLLESELFGYEKGAFTGAAASGKAGLFEAADGGTIFLDEIGEMGFDLQAKLLRVLQDHKFLRVGGTESIQVDVRVVASTNRDLAACVRAGAFRQDLFFRLKVVTIRTPPLRERKEDIVPLAKYFLDLFRRRFERRIDGFSTEAERLLLSYPWPGNVRELRNVIEGSVILESGREISAHHLRLDAGGLLPQALDRPPGAAGDGQQAPSAELSLEDVEKRHIRRVLNATMWQRGRAADILGIHRTTLTNKIRQYGLEKHPPQPGGGFASDAVAPTGCA